MKRKDFEQKLTAAGIKMNSFYEMYYQRFPETLLVEFAEFCQIVEQPLTVGDYHMAKNADVLFSEIKKKRRMTHEIETGKRA